MDAKEIFEKGDVLTLSKARALEGKTILVTNREYKANEPQVRRVKVELLTSWDNAKDNTSYPGYANQQEYWEHLMTSRQIEQEKQTYILKDKAGSITAKCFPENPYFSEPTFIGSDEDREIYFVAEDEN